jgi:xylose isomerase
MIGPPLALFFISTDVSIENRIVNGVFTETNLTDQKGWSWDQKPKKIWKSDFDMIKEQIVKGSYLSSGHYNKEARIRRKESKLLRKGVEFSGDLGF